MLEALKEHLNIDHEDEDVKLERIISSSKSYLEEDIAGVTLEYPSGSSNEDLLLNCCRYKYNNAFEYFEQNFKSQLLRLQFKNVVNKK